MPAEEAKQAPFRQYTTVFEWLQRESAADVVLLNNCPSYVDVYLNSLKHARPPMH
jgi:hypothetical protein